jgi:hypothetical protein
MFQQHPSKCASSVADLSFSAHYLGRANILTCTASAESSEYLDPPSPARSSVDDSPLVPDAISGASPVVTNLWQENRSTDAISPQVF